MKPFEYQRASEVSSAIAMVQQKPGAEYLAGGTSQADLMKEGVQLPDRLIDIARLPIAQIEPTPGGGLRIGANVKNAVAARDPTVIATYTAISEAINAGASPQIRNIASMAGNLLQRTRCPYLRDPAQACNKRDPGTGCAAVNGFNRTHAIFGQTDRGSVSAATCIATHPSDLAVGLVAHDAQIVIQGADGTRTISLEQLHRLPGETPDRDTNLAYGDLILAIELPHFVGRSLYLKVRDRASYAFALVSCAVTMQMNGDLISAVRIALGGVAHKPWRASSAEDALEDGLPSAALFEHAAELALEGALPSKMSAYKLPLGRELVRRALMETADLEPLQGPAGTALAASVGGIAGLR